MFKQVCFSYPTGFSIDSISFEVDYGELVVLLGANGSGKTTVLKLIAGLLKPSSGRVYVAGYDTTENPLSKIARAVGYIPQSPWTMFSQDTVYDEIVFTSRNLGVDRREYEARALSIASWLNLSHLLDRNPLTLSEGEARRLAIASAIVHNPKILLFDEPTSALDYNGKKALREIILGLLKHGYTIVIASHDIDFVSRLGNPRVIVLSNGRIVFDDTLDKLYRDKRLVLDNRLLPPQFNTILELVYGITSDDSIYSIERLEELIEYIVFNKDLLEKKLC